MSMARPISCDGFFHSGNSFYVEINQHRHPRCDSHTLYGLLTWTDPPPLLTKKGTLAKRQPAPHKDSPGHFYQAQCQHYGLNSYKQKPAAKKHLLAAFDAKTKTLPVPAHILALEKSLEAQYKAADEVEKEKAKIERKKIEDEREKERRESREEVNAMVKEFAAAGIVISNKNISGTESDNEERLKSKPISDVQLRKDISALSETQLRAMVENLVFNHKVPKLKQAAIVELDALKKAQTLKAKEAQSKGKGKGKVLLDETRDNAGEYIIIAPYLRDNWGNDDQTMKLKMSASPGGSHHWAQFQFGIITGVMRSRGALAKFVGDKTHLQWRGSETGEGQMTYEANNTASITFVGDGRIFGRMRWSGVLFEFIGKKVPRENIVWTMSVQRWKEIYRGINDRSYEYARKARWGGGGGWYGGDEGDDASSNSDTVGDPNSEDEMNEDEASESGGFNVAY